MPPNQHSSDGPVLLWILLLTYAALLWLVSPFTSAVPSFFGGRDAQGRRPGTVLLTSSIVASWIFSKSITNAANLGREFGLLGGLTYAVYYAGIPVCAILILRMRQKTGARTLSGYIRQTYGDAAGRLFLLIVLIRLFNEVWSNTEVVAGYFGAPGSGRFLLAALLFSVLILSYTLKGGMRTSLVTDLLQAGLLVAAVASVLAWIVPRAPGLPLGPARPGFWNSGVDLFLVALFQFVAYPFHDPVLTDRAFLSRARVTKTSFGTAGVAAGSLIFLFSLVGMAARAVGGGPDLDAPVQLALSAGAGAMALMMAAMMISGGSALDSALSSSSKAVAVDLWGRSAVNERQRVLRGRIAMVAFALLGNLPAFFGAAILKATTISGTVVLGLAPIFLFPIRGRQASALFLAPVGISAAGGILSILDPDLLPFRIGSGEYGSLLAWNLLLTALSWTAWCLLRARRTPRAQVPTA